MNDNFDTSAAVNTLLPLCEQAYSALPKLASDFSELTPISAIDGTSFGFAARTPGNVYVVFRGTETGSDWFQDCCATLTDCRWAPGSVHAGFLHVYDSIRKSAWNALADVARVGDIVTVTGHSLGAALAILFASDIGHSRVSAVYTFAGPRVGDQQFANSFATDCYRIVNIFDFVPRVPVPPLFSHLGKEISIYGKFETVAAHSLQKSYLPGLQARLQARG